MTYIGLKRNKHEAIERLELLREAMIEKLDKDGFDPHIAAWLNTVAWLLGYLRVKLREE